MTRGRAIAAASMLGALGVAAGAFGAHALRDSLGPDARAVYETGARYHLFHALAMLAVGCGPRALWSSAWAARGCGAWLTGTLVFSGSLYALAMGAPRWLGAITPLGGVVLIGGWIAIAIAARAADRPEGLRRTDP